MAKYEVIAAGLYGVQGEIPVGTIVDLKDEPPESMGAKIRKVGAKVAAPDDGTDALRQELEAAQLLASEAQAEATAAKAEADALRLEVEGLKAEIAKPAAKK